MSFNPEYNRGYANAQLFLGTQPQPAEIRRRASLCDPPLDDYDRGYHDALRDARAITEEGPSCLA